MKELEIIRKYPHIDINQFIAFLEVNEFPYAADAAGEIMVDETYVKYYLNEQSECDAIEAQERAKRAEEQLRISEEEKRKRKATASMLVTSGFNFEGYRIVKYSGYISGDDAMSVNRGYAWEKVSVRDELMASLSTIRRNALRELKEAAYNLGCNAVIGVDFDYITLDPQTANHTGGTTYQPYVFCVTANGNAVVIEKIEE